MKPVFPICIFEMMIFKMIILPSFLFANRLNSQNPYESEIHNELYHINFYMNIGISNFHV